jgi:hypothetical protein
LNSGRAVLRAERTSLPHCQWVPGWVAIGMTYACTWRKGSSSFCVDIILHYATPKLLLKQCGKVTASRRIRVFDKL